MTWLDFRDPVSTWTHLLWMILSVPATWLIWRRCRGNWPRRLSMLIFGGSMFCCFLGSSLYHGLRLPPAQLEIFIQLDHIGIFLLIAGTCTPIVFTMLRGIHRWAPLLWVWSFALTGIVLRMADVDLPPTLSGSLYLGMGWAMVVCFPGLARVVPPRALLLLPLGGALYSIGTIFYLMRWPNFWPGFGHHELLHLFVMAGSFTYYWFVLHHVVPFAPLPNAATAPAHLPPPSPAPRRAPAAASATRPAWRSS